MRLGCPRCGAHYEVSADAIPASGREVECSACGHEWVQYPVVAALGHDAPRPARPRMPPPDLPPEPEPDDEFPAETPLGIAAVPPADFRQLLREEAEREAAARRREGVPVPDTPSAAMPADSRAGRGGGGFMSGFLLATLPLALAAAVYVGAPRLSQEAPALAPPLARYTDAVDDARLWFDDLIQRQVQKVR
ncbi:zinc-ribbon domain-containing protein [Falsirhodobacter sp. alg1]|uniref:zinc-ribbon domain-containing protein n=1 Tax=Falsirhodobacter sp. alg1 TaxID=1472418 RepID=UPI0005EE49C1|nr:zinc-ribbon domain-containing protein [Falsirhodobacter sp. alg1]